MVKPSYLNYKTELSLIICGIILILLAIIIWFVYKNCKKHNFRIYYHKQRKSNQVEIKPFIFDRNVSNIPGNRNILNHTRNLQPIDINNLFGNRNNPNIYNDIDESEYLSAIQTEPPEYVSIKMDQSTSKPILPKRNIFLPKVHNNLHNHIPKKRQLNHLENENSSETIFFSAQENKSNFITAKNERLPQLRHKFVSNFVQKSDYKTFQNNSLLLFSLNKEIAYIKHSLVNLTKKGICSISGSLLITNLPKLVYLNQNFTIKKNFIEIKIDNKQEILFNSVNPSSLRELGSNFQHNPDDHSITHVRYPKVIILYFNTNNIHNSWQNISVVNDNVIETEIDSKSVFLYKNKIILSF